MKKSLAVILAALVMLPLTVFSFGTASAADTPKLSVEEQNAKALAVFERILRLTRERDRSAVAPKMEEGYRELIDNYPDSNRVQESFWRLMLLYLNDFNPPPFDRAEKLLAEYGGKYPSQTVGNPVYDTLLEGYYKHGKWEEILKLVRPAVKDFIEKGTLERPKELYYHSEAKRSLGVLPEAVKGYRIIIARFPSSAEATSSKQRLEEIEKKSPQK